MNEQYKTFDFQTPIEKTATVLAKGIVEKLADNKDLLIFETDKKNTPPTEPQAPHIPEPLTEDEKSEMTPEDIAFNEEDFKAASAIYAVEKAKYDTDLAKYTEDLQAYTLIEAEKKQREEACTDFAIEIMKMITETDIPADYAGLAVDKILAVLGTLKKYIQGTVNQYQNEFVSRTLGVKSPVDGKYRAEFATAKELLLKLDEIRQAQGDKKSDYFNVDEDLSTGADGVGSEK